MRQPLGVGVHISRDYTNIAIGHPLGIQVCLYRNSINIATGHEMLDIDFKLYQNRYWTQKFTMLLQFDYRHREAYLYIL